MKHVWTKALTCATTIALLALSGCLVENGDLVVKQNVCVTLEEVQTTGTFSTFVVVDKFEQALANKLKESGNSKKDVKSIHMVSATFKTMEVTPHDWDVTGVVNIARQDVPDGAYQDGPAPLVSFDDQSLLGLTGKPTDADLMADGVAVVNRALAALVADEDPRMVLVVENETVEPTPSTSDPMGFELLVCVEFQVVIAKPGNRR
jgi:hypothetical protein